MSADGSNWTYLGEANNDGQSWSNTPVPNVFTLEECIKYVKICDTSNSSLFGSGANAFDLDAIEAEYYCEKETAWGDGIRFVEKGNWATYFTYTVQQLPEFGMVLWLDAGKGITEPVDGGLVSEWKDQSGNDNDAAQTNSLNQPTYVEYGLNNRPVVRFTGESEQYLRHSPVILTDNYTAFYVLTLTESEGKLLYYYHAGDLGFFAENKNKAEGWGSVGLPDVRTSIVYPTLDDWRIHTHQPQTLYKNGTEVGYKRYGDVYAGNLTDIGSRSDHATLYFVGDIAEILVYDRILTVPEREMVETYLNTKYAIY